MVRMLQLLYQRIREHNLPDLGAQMAFYLTMSFIPFLILIITILSFTPLVSQDFLMNLNWLLPEETSALVIRVLGELTRGRSVTLVSVSIITAVWGASRGIRATQRAVNVAYRQVDSRRMWKKLLSALFLTFVLALAVTVAFVGLVMGQVIGRALQGALHLPDSFTPAWTVLRYLVSFVFMAGVFSLMYLLLPRRRAGLAGVLPGAVFCTLGWVATSQLFSWYVSRFADYSLVYGSLGAVVALIFWLYLSSMVFLLGGEINGMLVEKKESSSERGNLK